MTDLTAPSSVVAREGYTDALRVLLESGVSPNRPWSRQYDHTPLYIAVLFVEAGANISPIEYAHLNTPLSWANCKAVKRLSIIWRNMPGRLFRMNYM